MKFLPHPLYKSPNGIIITMNNVAVKSSSNILTPTLWKTCRVVANPVRLRILRILMKEKALTVMDMVRLMAMPKGTVSLYLKELQARGFIHAKRKSVNVFYEFKSDPVVPQAAKVMDIVTALFREGKGDKDVIALFSALRTSNAVKMMACLLKDGGWVDCTVIGQRLRISLLTVLKHRRTLCRNGFVEIESPARRHVLSRIRAMPHPSPAVRKLSDLCLF